VILLLKRKLGNYFYKVGIIAHYLLVITCLTGLVISCFFYVKYDLPAKVFFQRVASTLSVSQSPLLQKLSYPVSYIALELMIEDQKQYRLEYNRDIVGASTERSFFKARSHVKDNRLNEHYQRLVNFNKTKLRTIIVSSTPELLNAIKKAQQGDDIVIYPGVYYINKQQIYLNQSGTKVRPIRLRASVFGDVKIEFNTLEGLVMKGDYWLIENLKINGTCKLDQQCEHAIHIVGGQNLIFRNNELTNFNATIKANSVVADDKQRFPDHILFENNTLYNHSSRITNTPVTLIDVVTGSDWIVRKNFIANHSKHGADNVSYGLFLKGNGRNGLIESNIVDCEWSVANDGYTRVGISLGGGGTGEKYCRGGSCSAEHTGGIIKNNLVVNCSQDVALYLNKAKDSRVIHNTLINSLGIDVRFKESSVHIINNAITGRVRSRDGGRIIKKENNIVLDNRSINLPDTVLSHAMLDLCDLTRFKFSFAGAMSNECLEKVVLEVVLLSVD